MLLVKAFDTSAMPGIPGCIVRWAWAYLDVWAWLLTFQQKVRVAFRISRVTTKQFIISHHGIALAGVGCVSTVNAQYGELRASGWTATEWLFQQNICHSTCSPLSAASIVVSQHRGSVSLFHGQVCDHNTTSGVRHSAIVFYESNVLIFCSVLLKPLVV